MSSSRSAILRTTEDRQEQSLQAAKWLQHQMLLDIDEMEALLRTLGDVYFYRVGTLIKPGEGRVTSEEFLEGYASYVNDLKTGSFPDVKAFRQQFALVLTASLEALFALKVSSEEQLIRIAKPIIQVQAHSMHYSSDDHKFRPMVFGPDCITWGLQFSYPQIYQDPVTKEIVKVTEDSRCPNTPLYRVLQQWQRKNTRPTPMVVAGKQVNIPIRLGYRCFSWVNSHPQLVQKNILVATDRC